MFLICLIITNTVTSYDLPVNALRPARQYSASLYFDYRNPTSGFGFAAKTGFLGYDNAITVTFTTEPLPTDFNGDGPPTTCSSTRALTRRRSGISMACRLSHRPTAPP